MQSTTKYTLTLSIFLALLALGRARPTVAQWQAVKSEVSAPQSAPVEEGGWEIECVDCPKYFREMTDRSLRLDADGHPHVAYGGDHLYYAWHDGTAWHYETVDDAPGVGLYASFALDGNGYPHISYCDSINRELKYAYRHATGWYVSVIDSAFCRHTSLALDASGYPHISYGSLKYAFQDASGWHIEWVDSGAINSASVALDGSGHPHISYYVDYPYFDLKYAHRDASDWYVGTVTNTSHAETSLVLDGDGYPHISHGGLSYAYQDAVGWHFEKVDSTCPYGPYCDVSSSLALDGDGNPHVSYYDSINDDLRYAYRDASGWYTQTVDSAGNLGQYESLALDGNGNPHISYYDTTNHYLKHACRDGSDWHAEIVDGSGSVGEYTSLALDGDGYSHVSYYDLLNKDLKYAYRDASGQHIETVDSVEDVGQYGFLVLDGDGYPHVSYYDITNGDVRYAYRDGYGWHIDTVPTSNAGDIGLFTSLALDKSGYHHITYSDDTNDDLQYAYQDASGWHVETVDHVGRVGWYTSLTLDVDGYPHVSYYDTTNSDLKYAHRDASGWYTETVDSTGSVGQWTSLALDRYGFPHISYYDLSNSDLKYAYKDATGWHIGTVNSIGNVGKNTSLALDGGGYPHISYYDASNKDLRYAYRDNSGWHIDTVDNVGDIGGYISLALDEDGHPHISYYDASNRDLKYAFFSAASDPCEPDDICAQASAIATDGTIQRHTFHQYGDEDWGRFTVVSGTTYVVQATSTSPGADLVIELYDACGGNLEDSDDNAFGADARLVFTAPSGGIYYVRALNHDPAIYGPDVTYELSVRAQSQAGVAIIVAGRKYDPEPQQANINYVANQAFQVFKGGGIPPQDIYYLHHDATQDADEDGSPDVDATATASTLEHAITTWAASRAGPGTPLYLYLVDHGTDNLFLIDGYSDAVTPTQLDGWLTRLESDTGCAVNVIIESCKSGSFIAAPQEISKPGRVIVTSAAAHQSAYAYRDGKGAYFSNRFLSLLGDNADLWTCYTQTRSSLEDARLGQTPWLDDNGDAISDEQDGTIARQRGLISPALGAIPWIASVSAPAQIDGYAAVITATIYEDQPSPLVWAEIIPPSYRAPDPEDEMAYVDVPRILLADGDGDGTYTGTYGGFTEIGEYQVIVYARDSDGNQGLPRHTTVRTGWEVFLPLALSQVEGLVLSAPEEPVLK